MKIARNKKGEYINILDSLPNEEYFCMNCQEKVIRNYGSKKKFFSHQHDHSYDCELKVAKIEKELFNTINNRKINESSPIEEEILDLDYDENNPLLKGLNKQQIQAVLHNKGTCLTIAGAGAGKTLVLTHRIAYLIQQGISPSNLLAITFTKKASEEMSSRLCNLIGEQGNQVTIGTFHSICYHMIKEQNYIDSNVKLIKNWQQTKFINEILEETNIDWDVKSCLNFISLQKNNMITSKDNLLIPDNMEFLKEDLEALYSEYEDMKSKENLIDFNDMLLKCYCMLNENSDIRKYYQNEFKYILVDEFQDTNNIQFEILKLLLNEEKNLFCVGDDKQSIYGFNFANVNIMIDFQKTMENVKVIKLHTNYRSTKNIVDISNKLISHNKGQLKNNIDASKGYGNPVGFNNYYDEYEEGISISQKIKELIQEGYNYKDIAILYRCNSQSQAIEDKLIASKIPYIIIGGQNFFHRKEIMDITAYLRVILNHNNNEAIKRIINIPNRYLGNAFINQISNYASSHNDSIYNCLLEDRIVGSKKYWRNGAEGLYNIIDKLSELDIPVKGLINVIIEKIEYVEYLRKLNDDSDIQDKVDNINVFKSVSEKFDNLKEFLEYIDKMIKESSKNVNKQDKVKLLTIHRSKGLEFPIVFLIDVNIGLLPHKRSNNIEEERRICYVGLSRGQKELYISYTDTYNGSIAGESIFISNIKSKNFLKEIK
jgi:DNA helicase-2/ATP-dependent DNA helicase PcrA